MRDQATTLIELIIAMFLMGLIILTVFSIDIYSRSNVITSDRRVKLQNGASYVLDQIQKTMIGTKWKGGVVGNTKESSMPYKGLDVLASSLNLTIDSNANGKADTGDTVVTYSYDSTAKAISYFENATFVEYLSPGVIMPPFNLVSSFVPGTTAYMYTPNSNHISIQVSACWNPATADIVNEPNGTIDNPCISMRTGIVMPSLTTN